MSFQLLGYGSYVLPAVIVIAGWHYFWCRQIDAVYTKATGAALVVAAASAFMSLALGSVDVGNRAFRAGGYLGEFLAAHMTEYLSRMGSIIVILTVLFVALILATQFSFGRLFSLLFGMARAAVKSGWAAWRHWLEDRRRARERREVIAKHVKKGTPPEAIKAATERVARPEPPATSVRPKTTGVATEVDDDEEEQEDTARPGTATNRATPAE